MGLFGSLFTGVSGLSAESQSTAMISNNIANTNTIGFKRSEANFASLVTTQSRLSEFSPGTVSVNRIQRIDQQGPIQQTSSTTDAAISGNGFFPVKRAALDTQEFLYTRSGAFSEDSQGLLRNSAGFVLYGWPIDSDGELPANQGDLTSLVPLDVAFLGGLTRPTTSAELAVNLDAGQERIDYTNSATLGLSANGPAHFTRGLTVFDALGSAQTLSLEFHHIEAPTANRKSNTSLILTNTSDIASVPGSTIADGDSFTMQIDTTTVIFEYDDDNTVGGGNVGFQTIGELIAAINSNFTGTNAANAIITDEGDLLIEVVDNTIPLTLNDTGGTIIADLGMPVGTTQPPTLPPGNTTAVAGGEGEIFPDFTDLANAEPLTWWQVTINHPDGSELTRGLINFNGDGTLNAASDINGDTDIQLNDIDWGNGSALQNISIDISRFSQFSGNFDVVFADQNGAELGLRTGVEVDRDGIVVARFSNGATTDLYKIPIVTFSNANGLNEVSGTAFSETSDSGEENLREAGLGGAGFVEPSTIEGSNVDLADEFAKLIVSQRSFAANSRVVNTVDQMTQDLLRLR